MKTLLSFTVLLLAESLCAGATSINAGQTLSGEIRSPGEVVVVDFAGTAGETVAILMGQTGGSDSFDPHVELHGPDGSPVADATGLEAAYLSPRRLTTTGTYQIHCRDTRNLFHASFALTLIKLSSPSSPAPDGGTIAPGETKTGEIAQGDLDVFDFTIAGSATVQIDMTQPSGTSHFDPSLELHGPEGSLIAAASGLDSASLSECQNKSGTYLIVCHYKNVSFDASY